MNYYDTDIINCARIAHNANRVLCRSMGDFSQKDYDELTDEQKHIVGLGVKFLVDHPEATEKDAHDRWMKQKIEDGWIRGDVKDDKNKLHPCLVPYEQLPREQQFKDELFLDIVQSYFHM